MSADIVHRQDVRMGQRGGRSRLLLEARQSHGIIGQSWRQDLDGDIAAEPRIAHAINFAHAPGAEQAEHFVTANA